MTHDDFGFDPADTELARQLDAAAPAPGDADAVLAGLRPRFTRARRRRQGGVVAMAVAAVVLVAGAAFASTDSGNGSKVRVPPADRAPSTIESVPAPTTPTMPTTATVPTTAADGRTTTPTPPPSASVTTPGPTAPSTSPTTIDDHGGNRGPGGYEMLMFHDRVLRGQPEF